MITTEEFTELSLFERAAMILEHGVDLLDRVCGQYLIKLYRLGDFYVELWYRPGCNKIDRLDAVCMDEVLPSYEAYIDISDIERSCK